MKKHTYSDRGPANLPSKATINFLLLFARPYLNFKFKRKFFGDKKSLPKQFVLVGNHPSAFDNVYAYAYLAPQHYVSFISNRYYYFNKKLGKFFKKLGNIPKSIFASDIESLKNCFSIVKKGGSIGIMADVRLSVYGATEKVPDTTAKLLKKLALPIVVLRLDGSYMTKPKWANDVRKGLIEGHLSTLFTKEQVEQATVDEINEKMKQAIKFDDFEWLKQHPNVKYKSKKMAEGLEKVLYICPHCQSEFTLETKKDILTCKHCGFCVKLDNRYQFHSLNGFPHYFDNIRDWFLSQKAKVQKLIDEDKLFLTDEVVLMKKSLDGKTFLREAGSGVCTFDKTGLSYKGTSDGQEVNLLFDIASIFALCYLSGKGFQHYTADDYFCFCPKQNPFVSIKYYIASELMSN